ncbi:uncharacterized protein YbjT (DUF2867 family) [Rhizobium sp. BK275]|uniref:SDR family oxidoreductase n=1 Tax=Rhizobium sp. BK275 TaxID=2587077 RepID=UPI0016124268|nr:SDR family oxidoreductase [Rhizobium sp. BK275]MBB3389721.1 uncharacterized protein YbjT (DUF2867 family) [Rhizobium sp. BK275]
MKRILVLGAGGQIARQAIKMLADRDDVAMTLFLRNASKLDGPAPTNARTIEADVVDAAKLREALVNQDIVYANLAGDVDVQAAAIVAAMKDVGVLKLIFVTSLGIYDEVPGKFGEWNRNEIGSYLPPYRRAADLIEASGLDYAILRPAWLTDDDEVDYETTRSDEPFKGTEVSRKSVAALIVELIGVRGDFDGRRNLGVNKPNTDGDRPAFL